jgi:hypothetical protein
MIESRFDLRSVAESRRNSVRSLTVTKQNSFSGQYHGRLAEEVLPADDQPTNIACCWNALSPIKSSENRDVAVLYCLCASVFGFSRRFYFHFSRRVAIINKCRRKK